MNNSTDIDLYNKTFNLSNPLTKERNSKYNFMLIYHLSKPQLNPICWNYDG